MADYYPLLARAVAGLSEATPDARRSIYDRARQALQRQLRGLEPPIAEAEIERESAALEIAVARLEAEYAPPEPVDVGPEPAVPLPPGAAVLPEPEPAADETRADEVSSDQADEGPTEAPETEGKRAAEIEPAPAPLEAPESVVSPETPGNAASPEAAAERTPGEREKTRPRAPMFFKIRRDGVAPSPSSARGDGFSSRRGPGSAPSFRSSSFPRVPATGAAGGDATDGTRLAEALAPAPSIESPPDLLPPEVMPPVVSAEATGAQLASAEATGGEEAGAQHAAAEPALEPIAEGEPEHARPDAETDAQADAGHAAAQIPAALAKPRPDAQRPFAPQAAVRESAAPRRLWIVGFIVGLVVFLVAIAAYELRDRPEELRHKAAVPALVPEVQTSGKIVDRVGAGPEAPAGAPAPAAAAPSDAAQGTAASPAEADVQSTRRAALLVEAPDEPSKVKTFLGSVSWKTDNVSNGPGDPLSTAVRAEIDIPEEKLRVVVSFQKNFDSSLPASHTIKVEFSAPSGGPLGGVQQISAPQMRRDGAATGDSLAGVPVSIADNSFLVGLTRGAPEANNLDLLKSREWIDVPMLLSNGRIAKLTFEKGPTGTSAIDDAAAAWKAQ